MAAEHSGRLELTWTNKHLRLLPDEDGGCRRPTIASPRCASHSYDAVSELWSLRWKRADGRWHAYEGIRPAREVAPLLAVIDMDADGVFWG